LGEDGLKGSEATAHCGRERKTRHDFFHRFRFVRLCDRVQKTGVVRIRGSQPRNLKLGQQSGSYQKLAPKSIG
jgi:hypothetical protein